MISIVNYDDFEALAPLRSMEDSQTKKLYLLGDSNPQPLRLIRVSTTSEPAMPGQLLLTWHLSSLRKLLAPGVHLGHCRRRDEAVHHRHLQAVDLALNDLLILLLQSIGTWVQIPPLISFVLWRKSEIFI